MLSVPVLLPSMKMRDGVWRLAVWPSDDKDGADLSLIDFVGQVS
jgi:hypothetical protein